MSLIIYTNKCLSCTNKAKWKEIKSFAQLHNLAVQERRVGLKKEWAEQAAKHEIELPFIVKDKVALSLSEDLEGLL